MWSFSPDIRRNDALKPILVLGNTDWVVESGPQWHPSLYAGSARYYAIGRVSYPTELGDALTTELELDGSGRFLDVGCGPGNFTLLMAPGFEQVIGLDADQDMLAEAERRANEAGIGNAKWRHLRAEELTAGLGTFKVISFAQSFHCMISRGWLVWHSPC